MCDLSALRALCEVGPTVTIDSATLLSLIDSVIVVTVDAPKRRKKREKPPADPNDEKCARWLFDVLRQTAPKAREPNFDTWATDVRLMRERDGRTHKEICALFRWAHQNSFWRGNILSPKTLREHWDRLTIQRETEAETKKSSGGAWWLTDATMLAKAIEVGVGAAHSGESCASWEARIRAAIDNGGKPPAPVQYIRPPDAPLHMPVASAPEHERKTGRPEGLNQMMKTLSGKVVPPSRAA